jgi:membrane-bound acyltransferase YfiQ involved in biofilm formation
MEQKTTSFDIKALVLNTTFVLLCSVPKFGWACFILLSVFLLVSVFRFAGTKSKFIVSIGAIATAAFAYFSAYRFNQSTTDMPEYFIGVAAIQFFIVLALVLFFHFNIYKPNKEAIKAGA